MSTALSTKLPDPFRPKGTVLNHSQSLSLLAALPVSTLVLVVIVNQTAQWDNFTVHYLRTSGTSRISLRACIQRFHIYISYLNLMDLLTLRVVELWSELPRRK